MTESALKNSAPSENQVVFDLSAILNYPIQLVVQSWHSAEPLRWFSRNDDGIVAEGRFLKAPGLPLFTLEDQMGRRVSDGIPEDILAVTRLMPAMDFELAQACAASEAARELAESSPLLFILLVNHACSQPLSIDEFEQLLALKRTAILERAGLPGSKSLVRLVNRVELSPLLPWELEDVSRSLAQPEFLAVLRHHPNLHLNHLRFLLRQGQPLWTGMLNLVDRHSSALDITWLCRMIRDTLNMAAGNMQRLTRVSSGQELQEVHDQLVERFNSMGSEAKRKAHAAALAQEHGVYPEPPLPAIDGIEPLESWLELLDEGSFMHHCVGSYDRFVALGEVFIYRMMEPERLTISVERRNNTWVIGEVRGIRNANPSPQALNIVQRWVER
ncbi:PcfJ domain-containing protein [Marinobacter sp. 2_MG-2023]|uniref:PcfJ domain-containing protein n=1 Tax=Marinobacter sp. 2_MG-2023 TaxID=3062679 RepID=UPI0026E39F3E|nr:PcfJ domain-containing protein [Marinobacter sp. 2_MG-2023]MDO6442231.1 PcfJ domain-containing protein [Marinobacter sp. 2_MG-2023]